MLRPKINSYKEYDNEKKFPRLENSPPPHNFSNGPSPRKTLAPFKENRNLKIDIFIEEKIDDKKEEHSILPLPPFSYIINAAGRMTLLPGTGFLVNG